MNMHRFFFIKYGKKCIYLLLHGFLQDIDMLLQITVLVAFIASVLGHGRLISPPGRSTMWRYGYNTPKNYNDNQLYCGGFNVSIKTNISKYTIQSTGIG